MIDISKIPKIEQRQDSLSDQLYDLQIVANKMGMYDAADVIRKINDRRDFKELTKYACYIEDGEEPIEDCVLDSDNPYDVTDCIFAKNGMRREQCKYWKIMK